MLPANAPCRNSAACSAALTDAFPIPMKLQQTKIFDAYNITHYGPDHILLNRERRIESGVVVMPRELLENWAPGGFAGLTSDDLAQVRDLGAEIVLIGTGSRQHFPLPALLRPLIEAGIGFEVMDTPAACRTYNVLMAEGRQVAAALLFS